MAGARFVSKGSKCRKGWHKKIVRIPHHGTRQMCIKRKR